MRYHIIRRKARITLLFILLLAIVIAAAPYIYQKVFIHEEDFFIQDAVDYSHDHLPHLLSDPSLHKSIILDAAFMDKGYVFSKIILDRLNLNGILISTEFILKGKFIRDERDKIIGLKGRLFAEKVSLNENLSMPMNMFFEISGGELEIKSLRLGKSYALKGKINLASPFNTDLVLRISRADIRDFARLAKVKNPDLFMGIISGSFNINGSLGNLFSNGLIESKNGRAGPLGYDTASIKLEGFGPVINIVESNIRHSDSIITINGYVDLRRITKGGMLDNLVVKSDMKSIAWQGWDINKKGSDGLSVSKDIGDKWRVGFKTISREPVTTYDDKENPEEMSLEYKMGLENLKMKLKDNEEFFGVEHNIKF